MLFALVACDEAPAPPPRYVLSTTHFSPAFFFFETGSPHPTEESLQRFAKLVSSQSPPAMLAFGADNSRKTCVYGYTDTDGSQAANVQLSQSRAEWVADYLMQFGMPKDRLVLKGFGGSGLLVPTPPNTPEPQNRRVEVHWNEC
jgi:outer membrane protein OmpA-like peptidoglycan-associated protein